METGSSIFDGSYVILLSVIFLAGSGLGSSNRRQEAYEHEKCV